MCIARQRGHSKATAVGRQTSVVIGRLYRLMCRRLIIPYNMPYVNNPSDKEVRRRSNLYIAFKTLNEYENIDRHFSHLKLLPQLA